MACNFRDQFRINDSKYRNKRILHTKYGCWVNRMDAMNKNPVQFLDDYLFPRPNPIEQKLKMPGVKAALLPQGTLAPVVWYSG